MEKLNKLVLVPEVEFTDKCKLSNKQRLALKANAPKAFASIFETLRNKALNSLKDEAINNTDVGVIFIMRWKLEPAGNE